MIWRSGLHVNGDGCKEEEKIWKGGEKKKLPCISFRLVLSRLASPLWWGGDREKDRQRYGYGREK